MPSTNSKIPKRITKSMKDEVSISELKKNDVIIGKYKRRVTAIEEGERFDDNIRCNETFIHLIDVNNGFCSYKKYNIEYYYRCNIPFPTVFILKRELNGYI